MAMFGKEGSVVTRTDLRASADSDNPENLALSVIAPGMRIIGDVESVGLVKVEGRIEGSVTSARQVLLSRGASIKGSVIADEVVIAGTVSGGIRAADRLELQATSIVSGDIETRSIIVLEGAQINGSLRMTNIGAPRDEGTRVQVEPFRIIAASEPVARSLK